MGINLGDVVPDFKADTSQGDIQWHSYINGTWAILFSHPGDFTPVCTTELGTLHTGVYLRESSCLHTRVCSTEKSLGSTGQVGKLQKEFSERGIKLAALSCNDTESHKA